MSVCTFEQIPSYGRDVSEVASHAVDALCQHNHALLVAGTFQLIDPLHRSLVGCIAAYSPYRIGRVKNDASPAQHLHGPLYFLLHAFGFCICKSKPFFCLFIEKVILLCS